MKRYKINDWGPPSGGPCFVSVVLELLGEVEKEADEGHEQHDQKAAYGRGKAKVVA